MPKAKSVPCFDLEAALPAMAWALRTRLVLRKTELRKFKVPADLQEAVLGRLVQDGFEAMAGGVRVPLRDQLERILEERGVLSGAPGKLLKGGKPAEYKALVQAMAKDGRLQLLVRGKVEAIASPFAPVLTRAELGTLGQLALSLQKALKAKPLPRTLLREDVRELLMDLIEKGPAEGPVPVPGGASAPLVERLVLEARRLLKPELGLCFVPDLVLACLPEHTLAAIHGALVQAVRERRLELRPEASLGRLSPVEIALCPEGLQNTRLSWARPLEPRP